MMLNSGLWDAQRHYIDVIFASTVNFYSNLVKFTIHIAENFLEFLFLYRKKKI
jgi:hypothetical protein